MKHTYTNRLLTPWRGLLLAALLGLGAGTAQGQTLNFPLASATNVAGTYADLGTTGTAISTPNTDDANSSAQSIGFPFSFNGQSFTEFVLNTNGYIKLGNTAPAAPYFFDTQVAAAGGPLNNTSETNLLLPFNIDLEASPTAAAEYRVATTGTAPNRVCIIQWKNVSDKVSGTFGKQLGSFEFQVKLYETINRAEFVYGTATAGPGTDTFKYVAVGLKGSGNANNQLITAVKGSTQAWSGTIFTGANYTATTNAHNIRKSALPDAGRTYRFTPQQAKDAAVSLVYTLGKLPVPFGTPHVIRAFIRNIGREELVNVNITLTVTGANSFTNVKTLTSLPAGAAGTLSFDAFSPTATGNNNISVTIADDDDNLNNTATFVQQVNTTTYAYADATSPVSNSVGLGTGSAILATKYTTSEPRTVTAVSVRLEDTKTVGNTLYAVVCDKNGAIIGRSADYVVTAADISKTKVFTFAAPLSVAIGDFYTGIAQTANATTGYFPIGVQAENPTRTGAYYLLDLAGGQPADVAGNNLGRLLIEATMGTPPTCPPPSAITVSSITSTSTIVSFTGPANGTGYTILYGPKGFDPNATTGGTSVAAASSPFTLTGLSASTEYDLYIRANCGAGDLSALTGRVTFTTLCTPPIITAFPYTENFDNVLAGQPFACGISVADINADNNTWASVASTTLAASTPNAIMYTYNTTDATKGADDWFFTPALYLRAGSRYQLSFKYRTRVVAGIATAEKLEVKYGSATTPAGQPNLLWRNENLTNTTYQSTTAGTAAGQVMPITPAADGNVYIGFHAFSAPDQFAVLVDDIAITSVVTGVSDALVRAVNVYPNPTAGVFTVEVRGANAKGGLEVEVTNLLGQRVHTANIRDNFENKVNLSSLANGMYTVKVKAGNDYMIRQIIVQK
ncbi:Por secretion system C-terminal sorting domain-containing protein [Hymenobacter gelipurpurascens]|uniref:Por secretion system C-terminal sorting domain-containing protein n=1 Tax=Hymenobacter gelipurpurascens TaxID=89968 RepID=A0A212TRF2_9BACT|nr:T9SS type A sorting domain-containing protein [Hymenobacter gelipurpurascens]SNC68597.1 Por secretion system C-terminal sorting domain-containing protein [Hymenobacter gelipurpurascens]